jgi:ribosome-binding protein aMBF1 (putative translation factor)
MPVARAVRQARQGVGWSQTRLAHVLGVGLRTVQAWEAGERTPVPGTRQAEALRCVLGLETVTLMRAGPVSPELVEAHLRTMLEQTRRELALEPTP